MSSKIKVDNIADQGNNNMLVKCGSTLTIGATGNTVTLASGASQTGFGRTGTVDWQTGDIKTSTFTAVNGQGFFCDTNSGAFTCNLPAGSAGAIVSVQDYRNTFDTGALTITPNGSEKINTGQGNLVLNTEGQGITLVYIDSTVGWRSIQDNDFANIGSNFIVASGGTETTSGDCKIHTFTGPGTFSITGISPCAANNVISYAVVAGGGGGGTGDVSGGGGAGGYREVKSPVTPFTASPLDGYPSSPNRITATITSFPITVGAGGANGGLPASPPGCSGSNGNPSVFSTITAAGGGGGAKGCGPSGVTGSNGGSGGGGSFSTSGGTGNTPPTTPAQGTNGGSGGPSSAPAYGAGGGGGAGATGSNGSPSAGGAGGNGVASEISGSSVTRSGGGGGARNDTSAGGAGGSGGGGTGGGNTVAAGNGTANTGGGGGGLDNDTPAGGTGGSDIVIIRYKFQ